MATLEESVREEIAKSGPLEAYRKLIAQNDGLIRATELGNGRAIVNARTAIHTGLIRDWAEEQHKAMGYDRPFAVVALGGTGRGEMTPCSDTDFAFLFDDSIENNAFLMELQRQTINSPEFRERCGYEATCYPFNLDDVTHLDDIQVNSFLDMRPVYDPSHLTPRFRERIRGAFDGFEHFLHVNNLWKKQWRQNTSELESLVEFDIKNQGLRVFLAGIWTLAGREYVHSEEIYRMLPDPRDLEAYDFLLRMRCYVHYRRNTRSQPTLQGKHAEDVMSFEDYTSFGELLGPDASRQERFDFGNHVRALLLSARRRVARFTLGVMGRELRHGRPISAKSPIMLGVEGLRHAPLQPGATAREKSSAALSLLAASQHYGAPIDPAELESTYLDAGDWLEPVRELSSLFYEPRGSLATSFEFLSQLDGAQERLFPGYALFEASLDGRVLKEKKSLRGALERKKIGFLERFLEEGKESLGRPLTTLDPHDPTRHVSIPIETALLDSDHLAAVKLALKTKRLPLTPDDEAVRGDTTKAFHERFSSGLSEIPLKDYYDHYEGCDFSPETLRVTKFLVANRREFKVRARLGLNDDEQVAEFCHLCKSETLLRALYVFTCADRAEWESENIYPSHWFNVRELYSKGRLFFNPQYDPSEAIVAAGYSSEQLRILKDFGKDFFSGVYRHHANRFGEHLVRLALENPEPGPKAALLRDGFSTILGVAARDYRGLAASISGACWRQGVALSQAHLFSSVNYHLAMDFFHLAQGANPSNLLRGAVEEAIRDKLYCSDADEASLPRVRMKLTLTRWRNGLYCLRAETPDDVGAVIYSLTYRIFRHLYGNVFGLTATMGQEMSFISVYHSLPPSLVYEDAQQIVAERFV